jgi:hypothetical protein
MEHDLRYGLSFPAFAAPLRSNAPCPSRGRATGSMHPGDADTLKVGRCFQLPRREEPKVGIGADRNPPRLIVHHHVRLLPTRRRRERNARSASDGRSPSARKDARRCRARGAVPRSSAAQAERPRPAGLHPGFCGDIASALDLRLRAGNSAGPVTRAPILPSPVTVHRNGSCSLFVDQVARTIRRCRRSRPARP